MRTPLPLLLAACLLAAHPTFLFEPAAPPSQPEGSGSPVLDLPPAIGASADWWVQASEAMARAEHQASPADGELEAPHQAQQPGRWFRYDGAEVVKPGPLKPGGEWIWKWRTLAWGGAGSLTHGRPSPPQARGAREPAPLTGSGA